MDMTVACMIQVGRPRVYRSKYEGCAQRFHPSVSYIKAFAAPGRDPSRKYPVARLEEESPCDACQSCIMIITITYSRHRFFLGWWPKVIVFPCWAVVSRMAMIDCTQHTRHERAWPMCTACTPFSWIGLTWTMIPNFGLETGESNVRRRSDTASYGNGKIYTAPFFYPPRLARNP